MFQPSRVKLIVIAGFLFFILAVALTIPFRFEDIDSNDFGNRFDELISEKTSFHIVAQSPAEPADLPLFLRVRFPISSPGPQTGFPDASILFRLSNHSGNLVLVRADQRRGKVCHLHLTGDTSTQKKLHEVASILRKEFPRLLITDS